jgi:hypothetical protein
LRERCYKKTAAEEPRKSENSRRNQGKRKKGLKMTRLVGEIGPRNGLKWGRHVIKEEIVERMAGGHWKKPGEEQGQHLRCCKKRHRVGRCINEWTTPSFRTNYSRNMWGYKKGPPRGSM